MRRAANDGFLLRNSDVHNDILIPRYYDPRIDTELAGLAATHSLKSIDECVASGEILHDQGNYVPKRYYGTGPVPYVRTSDLANWEIVASPKHGVPVAVYEEYQGEQGVQPGDVLFVHEGTYLIGTAAMVTAYDGPLLFQHHLAKFRVQKDASFGPYYFLAAIESPPVQRQIRAKQFTADIIDSVVGRMGEVFIPIPKDKERLADIERNVKRAVLGRAVIRERLSRSLRLADECLRGECAESLEQIFAWDPSEAYQGATSFLTYRPSYVTFMLPSSDVASDILVPKYYDPEIDRIAQKYSETCELRTVGDLVAEGLLAMDTGDEVGKMAYGTGTIPFVRTSDLGSWELKREPKQGVSEAIFEDWSSYQDVEPGDILLVRDGTYLVGSSVPIFKDDLPLLYCGGIYRLRVTKPGSFDSGLLLALLNLPFVRKQIRNKQFTRDVIDTLGRRLTEVVLPVPKDVGIKKALSSHIGELVAKRNKLRHGLDKLVRTLYAPAAEGD